MVKTREDLNRFLETLSTAPDSQIDNKYLTKIFKNLITKDDNEIKLGLIFCIDHISYCSSAAGIAKLYIYEVLKTYFNLPSDKVWEKEYPWRDNTDFDRLGEFTDRFLS